MTVLETKSNVCWHPKMGSVFWTQAKSRAKIFHGLSHSELPQTFNYPSITSSVHLSYNNALRYRRCCCWSKKWEDRFFWEAAWVPAKKTTLWNISHCKRWVEKQEKIAFMHENTPQTIQECTNESQQKWLITALKHYSKKTPDLR